MAKLTIRKVRKSNNFELVLRYPGCTARVIKTSTSRTCLETRKTMYTVSKAFNGDIPSFMYNG